MERLFIPASYRKELNEYTNLVRVLRTNRALDLTTHLLNHAAQQKENETNAWTSWPVIDFPAPEWSLEDEVKHLGETVVKQIQEKCGMDDKADSEPDMDILSPATTNLLVFHTGAILVRILNLLADQRPSAPGSMQNRLRQMNWEDVISLLAVSGAVDHSIIARAEKRLERIYGPPSTKALQRLTSAKQRCTSLAAVEEAQLFALPVLSRTHRTDGKGESGPKSRAVLTDTDTDG